MFLGARGTLSKSYLCETTFSETMLTSNRAVTLGSGLMMLGNRASEEGPHPLSRDKVKMTAVDQGGSQLVNCSHYKFEDGV